MKWLKKPNEYLLEIRLDKDDFGTGRIHLDKELEDIIGAYPDQIFTFDRIGRYNIEIQIQAKLFASDENYS